MTIVPVTITKEMNALPSATIAYGRATIAYGRATVTMQIATNMMAADEASSRKKIFKPWNVSAGFANAGMCFVAVIPFGTHDQMVAETSSA